MTPPRFQFTINVARILGWLYFVVFGFPAFVGWLALIREPSLNTLWWFAACLVTSCTCLSAAGLVAATRKQRPGPLCKRLKLTFRNAVLASVAQVAAAVFFFFGGLNAAQEGHIVVAVGFGISALGFLIFACYILIYR